MLTLISGGAGSGKSAFAEDYATGLGGTSLVYLATMVPYDGECHQKISRHRDMRQNKGFDTVECARNMTSLALPSWATILLEDLPNWVANEWYGSGDSPTALEIEQRILVGIAHLQEDNRQVVVVSNELYSDGICYPPETQKFVDMMATLHCKLAQQCTALYEVVAGIPICHKKEGEG